MDEGHTLPCLSVELRFVWAYVGGLRFGFCVVYRVVHPSAEDRPLPAPGRVGSRGEQWRGDCQMNATLASG